MPGVVVAWLFPENTHGWFTYSMVDMVRWDAVYGSRHISREEGGFITISSGPRVAESRNMIVDRFAEAHPSAEWLLMIDSDMTFDPDLCERLVREADPDERPIMGGLCFAGGKSHRTYPTIYRELGVHEGWIDIERVYDYPKDSLLKVSATGGACLLVHRRVLGAMKKAFGTLPNGQPNQYPWFSEGLVGPEGQPLGEDIAFCRRATVLGIPIHVHTGIKTGHMKSFEITEERYLAGEQARARELAVSKTGGLNRAARRRAAREANRGHEHRDPVG